MPDRRMPDALFRTESAPFDVFFADVKVQERPADKKSADQIRSYFETLLELREEGAVSEVLFGIGTGDDDVAQAWIDFLMDVADANEIEVEPQRHEVSDEDHEPLIFVYIETPHSDDDDEEEDSDQDEGGHTYDAG
jgi:NAD(P)H-hydrate repair Nnr-like enzyme with NAD(P)H-hydrate dehydratase domain